MSDAPRYDLVRQLAKGGMGEVWLATLAGAAGWQKPVALKRVLPHLEDDPEFLTRFIDEARIAASLNHSNIVPIFDLGESEGMYFIAMEWVDGWDLRKLLRMLASTDTRLPPRFALYVAREIADGLAYAHGRCDKAGELLRIVHRDVSPSNILISRAGEVKITDFGIASARERLGKTVTGQLRGKFAYMSPEQATGEPVDGRSDLFALGALLFEMLCGQKPYEGGSDMATLENVRTGKRPELGGLVPELDPEVIALVERALAPLPHHRFATAGEMADTLDGLLHQFPQAVNGRTFRVFLDEQIESNPILAVQARAGGASLDDILNAQLSSGGTPTPSFTDSSRVAIPPAATGAARPILGQSGIASSTGGGVAPMTVTHAVVRKRRKKRVWIPVLAVVAAVGLLVMARAPGPVELRVNTEPTGATVYVDGVLRGVSNIELELRPGTHRVRLQLDGFDPVEHEITAEPSTPLALTEELRPSDLPIVFDSVPGGARVRVGDETILAGNTVRVPVGVPTVVRMELNGHLPINETHTFSAGDTILTRYLIPASQTEPPALEREPTEARTTRREPREPPIDERTGPNRPTLQEPERTIIEAQSDARILIRFPERPYVGEISIDGESQGTNSDPLAIFELASGDHRVVVTNAGSRFERAFTLRTGERLDIPVVWSSE